MSKIKIIVEIEKRTYELLKDKPDNIAEEIIANGTPYPQGKWINHRTIMHDGDYYCSNCDQDAEWLDGGSQFLSKFCPNCGAEMIGGAE